MDQELSRRTCSAGHFLSIADVPIVLQEWQAAGFSHPDFRKDYTFDPAYSDKTSIEEIQRGVSNCGSASDTLP